MRDKLFESSRRNGKSNAQVVVDLVAPMNPGTVVLFDQFNEALMADSLRDREYDRAAICGIVRAANKRLLREKSKMLRSVRKVGYAVAFPNDHNELCLVKKYEADRKLKTAFAIVRHADYAAMSPEVRTVTQGTLILVGALYQRQHQLEMRQDKLERIVEEIRKA